MRSPIPAAARKSTSIWTFKPRFGAAALICGLALTACTEGDGFDRIGFLSAKRAPSQIAVTSDRITIAGPEGFCIDTEATQDDLGDAFVLLGSCASISQSPRDSEPATPALLTASVAAGHDQTVSVEQSVAVLPAFFQSEAGRRALSRSGDPEEVELLETTVLDEMFVLHASDTSTNTLSGVEDDYWRGLFDLNGALVTISVLSFSERPISMEDARQLLVDFGRQVRAVNAEPPTPMPPIIGTTLASFFRSPAQ